MTDISLYIYYCLRRVKAGAVSVLSLLLREHAMVHHRGGAVLAKHFFIYIMTSSSSIGQYGSYISYKIFTCIVHVTYSYSCTQA